MVTASVNPPGPVIEGSTVTLVCEATAGDVPISYSWTGPNGDTANISFTLQASVDYGTYMCTATNEFGSGTANVETIQASKCYGNYVATAVPTQDLLQTMAMSLWSLGYSE